MVNTTFWGKERDVARELAQLEQSKAKRSRRRQPASEIDIPPLLAVHDPKGLGRFTRCNVVGQAPSDLLTFMLTS